jgi:hypothetical protein
MLLEQPLGRAPARAWRGPRIALRRGAIARAATASITCAVFAVYLTTLAPTVMWYDMGEFAVAADTLGIAHNTGYPLLILLGNLFTFLPAGDTAYRVNLMSTVFTALAIGIVFATIDDLTGDLMASAAGALTLAFAATVWANATWATSYGVNLSFTALIVRLMVSWHRDRRAAALVGAALAFGLALCNHRLIVLVAPPSLMLIGLHWRDLDRRTVLAAAGAFAAGLSVYLYLPIRGEQEPALSWARPAEWQTYLSMFLSGQTPGEYWRFNDITARLDVLRAYPSYDLTWAGMALAGLGLAACTMRDRATAAFFGIVLALDVLIVVTYSIHNIYNYLTPAYAVLAVLVGVGCAQITEFLRQDVGSERRLERRWMAGAVAVTFLLLPAALLVRNYERVDRSDEYAAHDFARTTLERLPPRAVVLTDSWTAPPLWYVQLVEGDRRDVFVTPIFSSPGEDAVAFAREQLAAGRPVYAAEGLRAPTAELRDGFVLQPVLLNGIETMVTDALPKPEYRDDLVARGSLYRLLDEAPSAVVASVPAESAVNVAFDAGVTLVGFERDADLVDGGSVVRLTYYWRAVRSLNVMPSAVTLFADARGNIASEHGWPAWQQSRRIAQDVLDAKDWAPGVIISESYFVLVPRGTAPGTYDVRLTVYDGAAEPALAREQAADGLVTVGRITVR